MSTEPKKMKSSPNKNRKPIIRKTENNRILYICPKCKHIWTQKKKMHRNLCMNCGQYLDWSGMDNVDCVYLTCEDMETAYFVAAKYEEIVGSSYGIDLNEWRLNNDREWPKEMMFPFLDHRNYGRFMRWAAKEGLFLALFDPTK